MEREWSGVCEVQGRWRGPGVCEAQGRGRDQVCVRLKGEGGGGGGGGGGNRCKHDI